MYLNIVDCIDDTVKTVPKLIVEDLFVGLVDLQLETFELQIGVHEFDGLAGLLGLIVAHVFLPEQELSAEIRGLKLGTVTAMLSSSVQNSRDWGPQHTPIKDSILRYSQPRAPAPIRKILWFLNFSNSSFPNIETKSSYLLFRRLRLTSSFGRHSKTS
jgi:hypothetical protein